jgi:divalent metal cation (Fe/Co/Zn/Cd) transporter
MRSLLLGEGAKGRDVAAIESAIESTEGVEQLIHLRTQHIGPDELLVAAKVNFDASYSMLDLATAIDRVESAVRRAVPIAKRMYIEPDIWRGEG